MNKKKEEPKKAGSEVKKDVKKPTTPVTTPPVLKTPDKKKSDSKGKKLMDMLLQPRSTQQPPSSQASSNAPSSSNDDNTTATVKDKATKKRKKSVARKRGSRNGGLDVSTSASKVETFMSALTGVVDKPRLRRKKMSGETIDGPSRGSAEHTMTQEHEALPMRLSRESTVNMDRPSRERISEPKSPLATVSPVTTPPTNGSNTPQQLSPKVTTPRSSSSNSKIETPSLSYTVFENINAPIKPVIEDPKASVQQAKERRKKMQQQIRESSSSSGASTPPQQKSDGSVNPSPASIPSPVVTSPVEAPIAVPLEDKTPIVGDMTKKSMINVIKDEPLDVGTATAYQPIKPPPIDDNNCQTAMKPVNQEALDAGCATAYKPVGVDGFNGNIDDNTQTAMKPVIPNPLGGEVPPPGLSINDNPISTMTAALPPGFSPLIEALPDGNGSKSDTSIPPKK